MIKAPPNIRMRACALFSTKDLVFALMMSVLLGSTKATARIELFMGISTAEMMLD